MEVLLIILAVLGIVDLCFLGGMVCTSVVSGVGVVVKACFMGVCFVIGTVPWWAIIIGAITLLIMLL